MRNAAHVILLVGLLGTPAVLRANPNSAVALAWDPSTDATVTGYNVYYGTASRSYTNVIAAGTATQAVVSNLASGVTYYFAATTHTVDGLESDYSAEASYSVPGQNVPPTLDALPDVSISQDSPDQLVQLTGIGSGSNNEVQTLTVSAFSSNPGLIPNPTVSYSSPDPAGTLTFSLASGSFGSSTITVLVDDGGVVSNTVIRSFTVSVVPPVTPPTIDPISNLTISENASAQTVQLSGITSGSTNSNQALSVTAVSSNPSLVPNPAINYSSPSSTGTLSFTPVANAFGSANISVTVTDAAPTNNTTTITFAVTVNQTVAAPWVLTNLSIPPNVALRYVFNLPVTNGDKFNISLAPGAPAGAKITTRKGVSWLIWTPTSSQASTTNSIGVKFTDVSNSALSTNAVLLVSVQDFLALVLGSTSIQAGQNGTVAVAVSSSEGVTNLSFNLPWATNGLANPSLSITAPGVASSSLKTQGANLAVNILMNPGQLLTGSNVIGSISFQSSGTQPSGYISLPIINVLAYKPNSTLYTDTHPSAGQVAIINNVAILQAAATATPSRALTVLGKTGAIYQVQYCTNLGPTATWYPLTTYTQTNTSQTLSVDPTVSHVVYRVQQK